MSWKRGIFVLAALFLFEAAFLTLLSRIGEGRDVIVGDAREVYGYLLDIAEKEPFAPRPFPFGSIVLWVPFFLLAKGFSFLLQSFGLNLPSDPASLFYQIIVASGSFLYGASALYLLFSFLQRFTDKQHAFFLSAFSLFCTPLLYYLFFEPAMSHVPALFMSLVFLHKLYAEKKDSASYFVLGSILGLLALIRTLDAFYGLLAIPFFKRKPKAFLAFCLGFLLFFSFQLLMWKVQFGAFFVQPYGKGFINYFKPRLFSFFFSTNHGLFLWHPYFLIAFTGLILARTPMRPFPFLILLIQSYVNSCARDWYGGDAFGQRRMISRLPLFALGLTGIKKRRNLYFTLSLLSFWNLLFLLQWKLGFIPPQGKLGWEKFFLDKFRFFFSL